ncbi:MAG: zinc ABC transporter substrate-binding protein [Oscillospiraceae bacterium]|nr:zinc ABC transporter substrate-binding protein [Oscillospiraceae bacterium]
MFKKLLALSAVTAVLFTGCSAGNTAGAVSQKPDKLSIVCTLFPEYDWTKELLGGQDDNIELTYLLNSGLELHTYQPNAQDMITISECDMFVYIGGESESWVDDALREVSNPNMKVIRLMDIIGNSVKEEEIKEGMEAEAEEEDADSEEETEYDEHVWLSVRNAGIICKALCDTLCELQPEQADTYRANLEAYTQKLDALDKDFADMADSASVKTVVFGDRFPFRYLVDDYGIDYYAAFVGCSAETEASFETITFLAEKLDELQLDTVFTIENADNSIANAIISSTENKNQQIAVLNSMQSVNADAIAGGASYLTIMQDNLQVLKEALN